MGVSFQVGGYQPVQVGSKRPYSGRGFANNRAARRPRLALRQAVRALPPPPQPRQFRFPMITNGTLTRSRRRYGRRVVPGSSKYARLYTKNLGQQSVYGLSDYTTYGGVAGAIKLSNWYTVAAGTYYPPCHLWDVSSAPNNVAGTVTTAQCGYRLSFSNPGNTGTLQWRTLSNPNSVIRSGHGQTSTASVPNNKSMLTGVSAKFMFYAPLLLPVRVKVALVQIMDDKFHPPKNPSGTIPDVGGSSPDNTALGVTTDYNTVMFWQQVIHNYVKNPVVTGDGNLVNKNLKVLKSRSFILNPKESVDAANTTYHQYNFYHKFNRVMKYNWGDATKVDLTANDAEYTAVQENKCSVEPRARLYLMVVADSGYNTGDVEVTTSTPSYDVSLRFYHTDSAS